MRFLTLLLFLLPLSLAQRGVYTDLAADQCKTLETGQDCLRQRCPGFAGYGVIAEEGDLRQNLTLIAPGGKRHSLELWSVVSSAFSSLGPRAEWRAVGQAGIPVPVALIVRYNASENPDNPGQITSYLAVTKIIPTTVCVTDKIRPSTTANLEARKAADSSAGKICLK